jgi:hypothetical protein
VSEQCRSCPAEVIFVPSAKSDKRMILNAKPEKRIVIRLVRLDPAGHECRHEACDPDRHQGYRALVENTYVDHHATCPAAKQWKGRRR